MDNKSLLLTTEDGKLLTILEVRIFRVQDNGDTRKVLYSLGDKSVHVNVINTLESIIYN